MAPLRASLGWASPALAVLTSTVAVSAEPALRILHDPIACITPAASALVRARTEPQNRVDRLSVLLKNESDSQFSRIDLAPTSGGYAAVLPLPSTGSRAFVYYLEAVDGPRRATTPVSRARVEQVAAKCTTETAPVQGGSPQKKRRRGAFIALGAAGAAALGIGILSGDAAEPGSPGGPEPIPPVIPPIEPPVPPTPDPVSACFDLPPSGEVGIPVRMDASCSDPRGSIAYEWNLGDGRTREGRVLTPSYSAPGLYVVELRVVRLTGATSSTDEDRLEKTILIVEVAAPSDDDGSTADLAIEKLGTLSSRIVDGVLQFHIAYTLTVENLGPDTATQVTVRDSLMSDLTLSSSTASQGTCSALGRDVTCLLDFLLPGTEASVRLEVDVRPGVPENTSIANTATVRTAMRDEAPANNQDTETTLLRRPPGLTSFDNFETSFASTIETRGRDGSATGNVRVNGVSLDSVNDTTSFRHRVRGASETVLVEGTLESAVPGLWRFDLGLDGRVIPGSIEALEGQVLGREPLAILFRLTGQPGERIRFTYRHRR